MPNTCKLKSGSTQLRVLLRGRRVLGRRVAGFDSGNLGGLNLGEVAQELPFQSVPLRELPLLSCQPPLRLEGALVLPRELLFGEEQGLSRVGATLGVPLTRATVGLGAEGPGSWPATTERAGPSRQKPGKPQSAGLPALP